MDFAENIVSNPVTIKLRREEESLDNIKQVQYNIIDQTLNKEQTGLFVQIKNSIESGIDNHSWFGRIRLTPGGGALQ